MNIGYARRHFLDFVRGVLRGHPGVRIERGVKLQGPGRYDLSRGSQISKHARIWVGPGATLHLGRGAKIGTRAIVNVETGVRIGARVRISWDVQILDTDFHWVRAPDGHVQPPSKAVTIEEDVLIGTRVLILKGVHVGRGSVIGAGAVVRRAVTPHSIVIGNPAQEVARVAEWGAGAQTPLADVRDERESPLASASD